MAVFYFGAPQRKDDGELYTMETEDFEEQRENLGKFLFDHLEVRKGAKAAFLKALWRKRSESLVFVGGVYEVRWRLCGN